MILFFSLVICRRKKELAKQTDPPTIPVVDLFPSGEFPEGEIQQYKDEWVYVIIILILFPISWFQWLHLWVSVDYWIHCLPRLYCCFFFFWAWLVVQPYRLKYTWSLAKICSSHRPKDNAYLILWFVKCRVIYVFLCFWFILLRHEKLNCLSNVFVYPTSILFFLFF